MKRFNIVSNGYDIDEVNRFIDIVISRLDKLNKENKNLNMEINRINNSNCDSDISQAIMAVSNTADKIISASKKESDAILDEARRNANSIVHEALVEAEKLEYKTKMMKKNIELYRKRIRLILEKQLEFTDEFDDIDV